MALFIATIFTGYAFTPKAPAAERTVGLDFIAFYTAGTFVREGRSDQLYDLKAVKTFQHALAKSEGVELGNAVGPWWNPPFYAWVFVPLARLPYPSALRVWLCINVLCAAAATVLLCRMLPRNLEWKTWALVPVLLVLSTPFIHALSHAQNTCTSLLLLALAVTAWRAEKPVWAGLAAGLLFYKPQLGAVFATVLLISLGWRVLIGLGLTGSALLLVTFLTMPGALGDYLHRLPANLHFVQIENVYLWERHVTLRAFWRLLLQGRAAGESLPIVTGITAICWVTLGLALIRAALLAQKAGKGAMTPDGSVHDPSSWHGRPARVGGAIRQLIGNGELPAEVHPLHGRDARATTRQEPDGSRSRDRLIAATIMATPLLMPFYFDYDQLLLAIPAVLLGADLMTRDRSVKLSGRDRMLVTLWPIYYAWLMLNPDVAVRTHVNLTVIFLSALAALHVARANARNARNALVCLNVEGAPLSPRQAA